MARLTNDEIRNISLAQADAYTDLHPAEAWRFAKAHGRSAIHLSKKTVHHVLKMKKLFAEPESVEIF